MIIALVIIVVILGIVSGILVARNYRRKTLARKEKIYSNCMDILNLDYIMVTDKNSGLSMYTQNFSEREIDAELISGFLQAIHSFGIDFDSIDGRIDEEYQSQILNYKDSIIVMSEFKNVRLILMLRDKPSKYFLYSVEDLIYDIYKNYGDQIDSFNGDVFPFKGIENLLKQHLNITFISPLTIAKIEKLSRLRINQNERKLIRKAFELIKKSKESDISREKFSLKHYFKRNGDDDEFPPYPYIPIPPTPPGDLGLEEMGQAKHPPSKEKPEYIPYCKHCGADLSLGQTICHVCGKKTN